MVLQSATMCNNALLVKDTTTVGFYILFTNYRFKEEIALFPKTTFYKSQTFKVHVHRSTFPNDTSFLHISKNTQV